MRKYAKGDNLAGYLFISPFVIGFLCLTVIPMIASLYLSLTNYDLVSAPKWVGFSNYHEMFTLDEKFRASVRVTSIYVLVSIPLRLTFALMVALLLNTRSKAVGAYRTLFYLPSLIGGSVAISIMWKNIFGDNGAVNEILSYIGLDAVSWFGQPLPALFTLIFLSAWQFGSSMLIFLAGLKNIPASYYEAASVDGANAIYRFFRITLPLLSPIILFNLIMQTISGFLTFTPAYILSKGEGGPLDGTLLYSLYLFRQAFSFFDMGYASAMAWVLLVVIALLTLLIFQTSKLWVFYESKGE
ncbi:MAG: sugar ABC transporter permease [Gorillibacterium sp.]|nr:sugar ABC transporter permease [Gorillibacterium sp.]